MNKGILEFQRTCYAEYLKRIQDKIKEIPNPYIFPDGNPIQPVLPVQTYRNSIMIIGAFPSARFERREGKLIPVANNLSPFGTEEYFDGTSIRVQASRESLDLNYFNQLGIDPWKTWLTDLVKIYLYPEKHLVNCRELFPKRKFVNTHTLFTRIAEESLHWMMKEINTCNPKLIITLGEVPAKVISRNKKLQNKVLLNGEIRPLNGTPYKIAHLAHPEIRRINKTWDNITIDAINRLAPEIAKLDL